ncbi:hypothetical protein [Epilithonimonas hungarica]|uniref:hypothetical protein n=1 Tax=Epilithonimonas hungarica TaxID=454006 RepID=UPI0027D7FEA1|nr:hypothetical protein [Epilithonimonas hungarica]
MKPFAVLIPEGIDIEAIVNVNPSLFEGDYIKYLINTVVVKHGNLIDDNRRSYNKEKYYDVTEKYVSIKSFSKKHKAICDYLRHNNTNVYGGRTERLIGQTSIFHRKGYEKGRPFTYRFSKEFRKQRLRIEYIHDDKLIRRIIKDSSKIDNELKSGKYEFMTKFFNQNYLKIDFEKAVSKCELRYEQHQDYIKYVKEFVQITNLYNGIYRLTYKHNSVGRFYTNLTQLNKVYREFITYKDKSLSEVDISNSVIFFLGLLLDKTNIDNIISILSNNNINSIKNIINGHNYSLYLMFSKSVENLSQKEIEQVQSKSENGTFYDSFVSEFETTFSFDEMEGFYKLDNEDEYVGTFEQKRKICKKIVLAMIFAKPTQYLKIQAIFRVKFPELLEGINSFKKEVGYEKLSHLLFQIEALFVLNIVARNFQ